MPTGSKCPSGYSTGLEIQVAVGVALLPSPPNVSGLKSDKCYSTRGPQDTMLYGAGSTPATGVSSMNTNTKFYELEEDDAISAARAEAALAEDLERIDRMKEIKADPYGINDMSLAEQFLRFTPTGNVITALNTASESHLTGTGRSFAAQDEFDKLTEEEQAKILEQIQIAGQEAFMENLEKLKKAVRRMLDSAAQIGGIHKNIIQSLQQNLFDSPIWWSIGTEQYHRMKLSTLHAAACKYAAYTNEAGFTKTWSGGIDLPLNVLSNDHVQTGIWGKSSGYIDSIAKPPSSEITNTEIPNRQMLVWTSDIDIPGYDDFRFSVTTEAVDNVAEDFGESSTEQFAESEADIYTLESVNFVDPNWPQGWLTNLETALAVMNYFAAPAMVGDGEDSVSGYKGYTSVDGYGPFSEEDYNNLERGDIGAGYKAIVQHNHAGQDSWTKTMQELFQGIGVAINDGAEENHCPAIEELQHTSNYRAGSTKALQTPALEQLTIISMLKHGGSVQQHSFAGAIEKVHPTGGTEAKDPMVALSSDSLNPASIEGIANSMESAASKFRALESSDNDYNKIGNILQSIAACFKVQMKDLKEESLSIIEMHKDIIQAMCEKANELGYNNPGLIEDAEEEMHNAAATAAINQLANDGLDLQGLAADAARVGDEQQSLMFKEQCFLLSFIAPLAQWKKFGLDRAQYKSYEKEPGVWDLPIGAEGARDRSPSTKRLPYYSTPEYVRQFEKNASILLDGSPYGFINRLTQNPKLKKLHNILNHELSNLQPRIRLYKVVFDEQGNEHEIEIKFDTHFTASDLDLFTTTVVRGVGSGLKSFNFTYDGSNPFSVKKSIKGNLKIFANSFSELLRERPASYKNSNGQSVGTTYMYTDLAMKTWNTADVTANGADDSNSDSKCTPVMNILKENVTNAELNFRLKAHVGLAYPPNQMTSMNEELREALSESYVTLNLTPTVHNFEIDDQGRVLFNINYLAYIEQFFDQKHFNVFATKDVTLQRYSREFLMDYYNSDEASCSSEQINQKKSDYANVIDGEKSRSISSLIDSLLAEDLIYYINISYSRLRSFLSYGPWASYEEIFGPDSTLKITNNESYDKLVQDRVDATMDVAFSNEDRENLKEGAVQAALIGNDPTATDLAFFYFSDLIDTVLLNIEKELEDVHDEIDNVYGLDKDGKNIDCKLVEERKRELKKAMTGFKSMRILLGPLEVTHPQVQDGKRSLFINIGDIPISVKYFVEWMTHKMLQKDEAFYAITKFVNDMINNLISTFLNNDNCFGFSIKQKTRLSQAAITSFSPNTKHDSITLGILAEQNRLREYHDDNRDRLHAEAKQEALSIDGSLERAFWGAIPFRGHTSYYQNLPILNLSGPEGSARTSIPVSHEYNYFVYTAGRVMPAELQKGDKISDEERGIFHYKMGLDRGLIKNIKLTKTQTKGLAEVRFETDGYDGLQQLRVVYDAQIDMYANVNTFPGTYIFIDPRGFAPELPIGLGRDEFGLTDLGIGGYYMIIRSEHEFAEGKANTILHTKWVHQIDREGEALERQRIADSAGVGGQSSRKCNIKVRSNDTQSEIEPNSAGWWPPWG